MPREFSPRHQSRSKRRRKKKNAPVGLILGLVFGGIALVGMVVAIIVTLSPSGDGSPSNGETAQTHGNTNGTQEGGGLFGFSNNSPKAMEPKPFHDEGEHKVARLLKEEVRILKVERLEERKDGDFVDVRWRFDYEFFNGGFRRIRVKDIEDPYAYKLRARGQKMDAILKQPVEISWRIMHPANQHNITDAEVSAKMLDSQGSFDISVSIPLDSYAPPYTFWFELNDYSTEDWVYRVSNFAEGSQGG